ncbi:MAG: penicillin-binding protein activator LpoB [Candidatus Cloacimonetes bacterium]|nr:penicillin-binding protein activator LpoB [Candidatus Cloacimonadota bacterium]
MRKIPFFFIFICFFILLNSQPTKYSIKESIILDEMFDEATKIIIKNFNEISPNKTRDKDGREIEGVGILPIENDIGDKFFIRLKPKFTNSKFNLFEKGKIENLLKEQAIQTQDFYSKEGRLKIGQLTQWKGVIFGKLNHHIEKNLGKEKIYFEISLNFDNLETGQIVWSEHYTTNRKVQYPITYFAIGILLILGLTYGLNLMNRGKKTSILIGLGIILMILYSIWFFII